MQSCKIFMTTGSPLVQTMAYHLFGIKSLSNPIVVHNNLQMVFINYLSTDMFSSRPKPLWYNSLSGSHLAPGNNESLYYFHIWCLKLHLKMPPPKYRPFCLDLNILTFETEWRIYASVNWPSLVQIMACRLNGAKPLSEPMLEYC